MTIAFLHGDHPAYLKAHLRFLTSLNKQTRDKFRVLLIDDASHPQLRDDKFVDVRDLALFSMRIYVQHARTYRISPRHIFDIDGARNLVFTLAQGSVICLDIDMLMDRVFLDELINMAYDLGGGTSTNGHPLKNLSKTIFRFNRRNPDGIFKVHWGVMSLSSDANWAVGGCDEDFVGHYGGTNVHFFEGRFECIRRYATQYGMI